MKFMRQKTALFLALVLVSGWCHAAWQQCQMFASNMGQTQSFNHEQVAQIPCHADEESAVDTDQTLGADCLGVCDCGLQAIPMAAQVFNPVSEYQLVPDTTPAVLPCVAARQRSHHYSLRHAVARYQPPANACLHPLQKTCIQLK